ncbi:hypothetical protein F5Y03DRAFT_261378 [Xylaria venustula]|nr:hypothetical protein F5Y03DRAFT_261378 [Xylaria venustula]
MASHQQDVGHGSQTGTVRHSNHQQRRVFFDLFTGGSIQIEDVTFAYFVERMRSLICTGRESEYLPVLHPEFEADQTPFQRLFRLLCSILRIARATPATSIQRLRQRLSQDEVLLDTCNPADVLLQEDLLFSSIGWLTCLYLPSQRLDSDTFRIETAGAKYPPRTSINIAKAQRPMDELLSAFGETVPLGRAAAQQTKNDPYSASVKFHVSCLNAATLQSIAKVKFIWVDTISAHLDFDPTVPALYLFRSPSFCKLQATEDSILALFIKDAYTSMDELPGGISVTDLMNEIILSYKLIFCEERSSRKLYRLRERNQASIKGQRGEPVSDPVLDRACGFDLPVSILSFGEPFRETYHAESNFPILRERLLKLSLYVDGIQPNHVTSLWTDRRDMRLWYTFWAVLIIGGINIVQSFISIFLSAAQVGIAQRSFELQQKQ